MSEHSEGCVGGCWRDFCVLCLVLCGLTLSGCGVFMLHAWLVWTLRGLGTFSVANEPTESSVGLCDGTKIKIDTYSYVGCM